MGGVRSAPGWRQVYRALEHGPAKNACKSSKIAAFPASIQEFANAFVTMQEKRHNADYDPQSKFLKSEVLVDIELAERAIEGFDMAPLRDRRAFAAFVLFKDRA